MESGPIVYGEATLGGSRSDNFQSVQWRHALRARRHGGLPRRAAPTGARPDVALPLHISGTLMILVSRAGPLLLLVTTLIAGCAGRGIVSSTSPPAVSQPVEDADTLTRAGRYAAARERYTTVLAAGRDAPDELLEVADTITEMTKVRHVYDTGVRARRGLDY